MEELQKKLHQLNQLDWLSTQCINMVCLLFVGLMATSIWGPYKVILLILAVITGYMWLNEVFEYYRQGVISNAQIFLLLILSLIAFGSVGEFIINANLY